MKKKPLTTLPRPSIREQVRSKLLKFDEQIHLLELNGDPNKELSLLKLKRKDLIDSCKTAYRKKIYSLNHVYRG